MKTPYFAALAALFWATTAPAAPSKIAAQYCPSQSICHQASITLPHSGNPKIEAWAKRTALRDWKIRALTPAALKMMLWRDTDETLADCKVQRYNGFEVEGRTQHYTLVHNEDYLYICAAHGWYRVSRYVLDKNAQPLPLKSIVLPHQMAKLNALQKRFWLHALKNGGLHYGAGAYSRHKMSDGEIQGLLHFYPFEPSDNWSLNPCGLEFQYQAERNTSYSMGYPAVVIPTRALRGIIKPAILREVGSFKGVSSFRHFYQE